MDFTFLGVQRRLRTVVVLCAGATRGASFVDPRNGRTLLKGGRHREAPPLDADYFRLLQRLPSTRARAALLSFVRGEYGSALDVAMERFYTEAEASNTFHQTMWTSPGPRLRKFKQALDWFLQTMPNVFEETVGDETCDYHAALVRKLDPSDSIMSYNYDCLIDSALRDHGGNRWRADKGYGFEIASQFQEWQKHGRGRKAETGIELLKPHGSLNWECDPMGGVTLRPDPYALDSAEGRIVPPSRNKNVADRPFVDVWRRARVAVAGAKSIVMIGYSMPEQDLMSHVLLRTEARSGGPLDALVLVNPDRAVRERLLATLAPAIGPTTRVAQ